jgi:hypothetical protein
VTDLWLNPAVARAQPGGRGQRAGARRPDPTPALTGQARRAAASPSDRAKASADAQLQADLETLRLDPTRPPRDPQHLAKLLTSIWPHTGPEGSLLEGWDWPQVEAFGRVSDHLRRRR